VIPAVRTELTKLLHSTVVRATTILLLLGITAICSSLLLAVDTTDPQLAAKLGPLIDPGGWAGYLNVAAQVTSAASLLGYGAVLSWSFGREFGDGTITGLFALPVSRPTLAAAKLLVYLVWSMLVAAGLLLFLVLAGLACGLGPVPSASMSAIGRQFVLAVLTAAIATPVAWAATLGRSVLAGIAVAIGILVISQVSVIAGAGGWFPFAAPALWAVSDGTDVSLPQLSLVLPVTLLGIALAIRSWQHLELDR
jgi:ABC-2 type transport system permease protein